MDLIIAVVCVAGIIAINWWVKKHPNRSKEYPERIRMTKLIMIVGWLFIGTGVLVGLEGFITDANPLPPLIFGAGVLLMGLIFLGMYRNFYIVPGESEIAFRTIWGREHVLPYSDIASYQMLQVNRRTHVNVKSIHGVKLGLDIDIYNVSPLLRAIEHHEATGRWPIRGEVSLHKQQNPSTG